MINFILWLTTFVAFAGTKSSEIPPRREFPVNTAISPCSNFYDHACSLVRDSFELREDRSRHTFSFSDSAERLLEFKKNYFKNLAQIHPKEPREKDLKNYYMACMDAPHRSEEEKALVNATLKDLSKIKERAQLLDWFGGKILSADSSWISFDVISNLDQPNINDVVFYSEFMSLPEKSYYEKKEVLEDLRRLMVNFFKAIHGSDPEKQANTVLEFEKRLAADYPLPEEFRTLFAQRTRISRVDLTKNYPALRLEGFLKRVPKRTLLRHIVPKAMALLNQELQSLPLDDLKTIYTFHSLSSYLDDAYPDFYQEAFDFRKKHLGGPNVRPDRQERCTTLVMGHFNRELDSLLWKRFFPNFPEKKVVELAEDIRASLIETLKENSWLSPSTKKEALKKIQTAKLQLVAPRTQQEWDLLPLGSYSETHTIQNQKSRGMIVVTKTLKELAGPISPERWSMGPLTVNAYYDPSYNKFVLPIGILQYPFFDPALSKIQNLAAMGSVIGHELGHSIDDEGSKYDARGKLRDWMTAKDHDEFHKRTAKLVDQFNSIGHNGKLTLGENIGDLVGVTSAYRAALGIKPDHVDTKQNSTILKNNQREFFLQYARVWCEQVRPKYAELLLKTDPHSAGYARVNEQMKQQPGFKEAFECQESDPMILNSKLRVKIW